MDFLIESRVPLDTKAAHIDCHNMPKNIASLPSRLRMKILFRSEEDFYGFDQNNSSSSFRDWSITLPDSKNIAHRVSAEKFLNTDFFYEKREESNHPAKGEISPIRISLRTSHRSEKSEQEEIFQRFTFLPNDAIQINRNPDFGSSDNSIPGWYQRSLEFNKSISDSLERLPALNKYMQEIIEKQDYIKNWRHFSKTRHEIQDIFLKLLESNIKFCCKENIEMYFWKVLYYNAIEYFKQSLKNCNESKCCNVIKEKAMELITDGMKFYNLLLNVLRTKYTFDLDNNLKSGNEGKSEFLVKVSAQKIFLSLGDLSRYAEQIKEGHDFSESQEYYHIARNIIPTNGIPYNQLAILSIYSKKKFDAIYYHMRSLTASNPIYSAKESLKVLFDEIRKKFESSTEIKPLEQRENLKKSCYKLAPIRKEVWIHPDGSRRLFRITPYASKQMYYLEEKDLKELSCDELFKRFQLSYLCIVGKLFTKIGMENFVQILFQMLSEFQESIERGSFLHAKHRLLQIISLNIFTIECNIGNNSENGTESYTEVKNHAFNVSSLMFGIILNNANELLTRFMSSNSKNLKDMHNLLPSNLITMLQAIKVWCDWLSFNLASWIPLPSISNYNLVNEFEMNPWDGFAELITLLSAVIRNNEIEMEVAHSFKLEEDIFLEGFSPIYSKMKQSYSSISCENIEANLVRIKKIIDFGSTFLCRCTPPVLKRISNDGKEFFINISSETNESNAEYIKKPEFKEIPTEKDNDELDEELWNSSFESDRAILLAENSEINELIKRKQELEERKKMEETYQQNLQDILRQFGSLMQIEVRPKYLVPDTNCFIDSLNELQVLANEFEYYLLAVPLVVLNELEGLSKGIKPTNLSLLQINRSKIHHSDEVSSAASKALQFIKSKNFSVKCVTTKGSFLNTSAFTIEEHCDDYQSNDDKILATAYNLGRANIERNGNRKLVSTSVVLLTTDRNLRVKALSKNLPVSELQEFLRWAKMEI